MLHTRIETLDAVLEEFAANLAGDFTAYRNHTYRVVNFCAAMVAGRAGAHTNDGLGRSNGLEKIAIAAAFHDLGIWTAHTFDYLEPSVTLARAYLERTHRTDWADEISAMIREHHKVSRARAHADSLVELFRKADWIDVTRGIVSFGLPRARRAEVFSHWPDAGFHWRLAQLAARRLRTHPLNPLPMFRL